ncbi:uncharacterized protein LOC134824417 [Bolinopsis microptera]|uniref:uncharacterized protein LOC134824417 n=1 Tax=Bolinopsis microptera TaxID=2820187 RepID=UPI003079C1F6
MSTANKGPVTNEEWMALADAPLKTTKLIMPVILIPILCIIVYVMVFMNIREKNEALRRMGGPSNVENNGPNKSSDKTKRKTSLFPISMGFGIHTQRRYNAPKEQNTVEMEAVVEEVQEAEVTNV